MTYSNVHPQALTNNAAPSASAGLNPPSQTKSGGYTFEKFVAKAKSIYLVKIDPYNKYESPEEYTRCPERTWGIYEYDASNKLNATILQWLYHIQKFEKEEAVELLGVSENSDWIEWVGVAIFRGQTIPFLSESGCTPNGRSRYATSELFKANEGKVYDRVMSSAMEKGMKGKAQEEEEVEARENTKLITDGNELKEGRPKAPKVKHVDGFIPFEPDKRNRFRELLGTFDQDTWKSKKWFLVRYAPSYAFTGQFDARGPIHELKETGGGEGVILKDDNPGGKEMRDYFANFPGKIHVIEITEEYYDGKLYPKLFGPGKEDFNGVRGCTEDGKSPIPIADLIGLTNATVRSEE